MATGVDQSLDRAGRLQAALQSGAQMVQTSLLNFLK